MGQPHEPIGYHVGVDVGTSFSAAAFLDRRGVRPVSLGEEGTSIPSVVAIDDDGRWVYGRGAEQRGRSHPELVVRDFKRRFGDPTPFVVGGSAVSAAACVTGMYEEMVRRAAEQRGVAPTGVVATHPANWGTFKVERFVQELSLTMTPPALVVSEPLAVARAFLGEHEPSTDSSADQQFAVYDLGGGTFDVAIVRATSKDIEMVGRPGGVERLGGIDIDAALWHRLLEELEIDPVLAAPELEPEVLAALARLRADLVEAKHLLSIELDVTIPVFLPSGVRRVRLERVEFDRLVAPVIDRSIEHLVETIERNSLGIDDIDFVVLAGGSSSIPTIARRVVDATGIATRGVADPQTAAARGAAHHLRATYLAPSAERRAPPDSSGSGEPRRQLVSSPVSAVSRNPRTIAISSIGALLLAVVVAGAIGIQRRSPASVTANLVVDGDPASAGTQLGEIGGGEVIESGRTTSGIYGDGGRSFRFPSSGPLAPFTTSWEYTTPLTAFEGITVNDGVIYVSSTDPREQLLAVDVVSGRVLWSSDSPFARSPTTWADSVVVVESSARIKALSRTAGSESSTVVLDDGNIYRWIDAIEIFDGVGFYSITADDFEDPIRTYVVTSLDLSTSEVLWERPVPSDDGGDLLDLAVTTSLVVVAQDEQIVALDRASGEERWRVPVSGGAAHVATTEDVIVVSGRQPDEITFDLSVIDAASGELRFSVVSATRIPTLIGGDLVLVETEEGSDQGSALTAVGLGSGLEAWAMPRSLLAESPIVAMVEGPDLFFVVSGDGTVTALTLPSSDDPPRIAFTSQLEGPVSASTHFHLTNGFLVEYDRSTGKLRVYR